MFWYFDGSVFCSLTEASKMMYGKCYEKEEENTDKFSLQTKQAAEYTGLQTVVVRTLSWAPS